MKITVVGGFGGGAPHRKCTSILIDDELLIDIGAASTGLSQEEKLKIKSIFISHVHLDHIRELPSLCRDFKALDKKVDIYCSKFTEESLRDHIFNGSIYENILDQVSTVRNIVFGHSYEIGNITVTPIKVNHPCDAYGYLIKKNQDLVFFTIDTGPSESIWSEIKKISGELKAIFIDVSFPNRLQSIADVSGHHTPQTLRNEMQYMPKNAQVYALHVKPFYLAEVKEELKSLGIERLKVVDHDKSVINLS